LLLLLFYALSENLKKRGSSNFIPLEKKDFSKIIYGEQLHASPHKHDGDLKAFEALLLKDDLEVVLAISNVTQITEADAVAKALIIVFQDHDKVIPLLKSFISLEIKLSESAGTLFRNNSMVSKMFKFYSRLIGLPYLYMTVGPELDKLIFDEVGLEVDPEKMEEGTDLDEMRWKLMAQSQKILKQIFNSTDKCPPQFRLLFSHLKTEVEPKYSSNVYTTIGGFLFLRFFCPAISTPESYGILDEPPSANSRRLLILITKVLQNLSNDVEFGAKEQYMVKMNDFIQTNRPKLLAFYDRLLKAPSKPPVTVEMPKNMKPVSLALLAAHVQQNLEKFEDKNLRKQLENILGKTE